MQFSLANRKIKYEMKNQIMLFRVCRGSLRPLNNSCSEEIINSRLYAKGGSYRGSGFT